MRNCHLKKSKQTSVKNNSYKSPTKFLQNCRRLYKANNLRPEATRDEFAATPLTVSRKQMFIPVHAKRGRFAAACFCTRPETAASRGCYQIPTSFRGLKSRKKLEMLLPLYWQTIQLPPEMLDQEGTESRLCMLCRHPLQTPARWLP